MAYEILMPALSPTKTEGTLVKWRKKEGDLVSYGDVLVEIETDKATMEGEAVEKGYLGKISVPEGTENVSVNQVIGFILQEGEDITSLEITSENSSSNLNEGKAEIRKSYTSTPLARRIAEERGLDITAITGTGAKEKITRKDVEATAIPTENSIIVESKKNEELNSKKKTYKIFRDKYVKRFFLVIDIVLIFFVKIYFSFKNKKLILDRYFYDYLMKKMFTC